MRGIVFESFVEVIDIPSSDNYTVKQRLSNIFIFQHEQDAKVHGCKVPSRLTQNKTSSMHNATNILKGKHETASRCESCRTGSAVYDARLIWLVHRIFEGQFEHLC